MCSFHVLCLAIEQSYVILNDSYLIDLEKYPTQTSNFGVFETLPPMIDFKPNQSYHMKR